MKITEKELELAKKILSGDDNEIEDMVLIIKNHKNPSDLIDYIDDVQPAQMFEFTFSVEQFLNFIK